MVQLPLPDLGLHTLYDPFRHTRTGALDWLDTLPPGVLTQQHEGFAYGSLRAIYKHIADLHLWWTGSVGHGLPEPETRVADVAGLRDAFVKVDATAHEVLATFRALDEPLGWNKDLS